jgi:hypothetical protein
MQQHFPPSLTASLMTEEVLDYLGDEKVQLVIERLSQGSLLVVDVVQMTIEDPVQGSLPVQLVLIEDPHHGPLSMARRVGPVVRRKGATFQ